MASSGVEYAQAYRAGAFRKLNLSSKFIFTDMILADNIEHLTANIGFDDEQVIWLYNHFTDIKIAPTSVTVLMSWLLLTVLKVVEKRMARFCVSSFLTKISLSPVIWLMRTRTWSNMWSMYLRGT